MNEKTVKVNELMLKEYCHDYEDNRDAYNRIIMKYPVKITAKYLSLINKNDFLDPIRIMSLPSIMEEENYGVCDTSGENQNTVIKGLQHKYRETALILSTNQCAMYCRYCFRKRIVGKNNEEIMDNLKEVSSYIREHKEIDNVLISGGDSFMNSNEYILELLEHFVDINSLNYIRFGTKVPVVFPERIDSELIETLKSMNEKKQIFIVTQFNHPRELTDSVIDCITKLKNAGLILKNQSVLLKNVNDNSEVLIKLFKKLVSIGIVPYYIFQCRPVKGVINKFQVPLKSGVEIINEVKRGLSGIEKNFKFVMSNRKGKLEIIGFMNDKVLLNYHECKDTKKIGLPYVNEITDETCWFD